MIQLIWDRSTVRLRPVLVVLALVGTLGCNSSDELSEITEPASTPEITGAAPVGSLPSFASSFRGGIPFGTWALPTSEFGPVYNGAMRNIWPPHLLEELAAIKARGGKVVLELAGPEWYYQDRNGYFSLSMWKERVNRFKGVDFTSYLEDGTIIGHYMIDEPNDPRNWNNRPVEGPMLEQMAAYSKQLWPKMTTIVRAKPTYMGKWGTIYRHLDAAWAQWWTISGDPADYIRREVAEAQRLGLGLIAGLNIRKGGPNDTHLKPSIVQSAGSVLLAQQYPCAFISWEYDEAYLRRDDVRKAMEFLSNRAEDRPIKSCARRAGGGDPPRGGDHDDDDDDDDDEEENRLPTADFDLPSCTAGVSCRFEDDSQDDDGDIESWSWEFGDGGSSTDRNPAHTFATAGSYSVTLRVTDDDGASRSVTASVSVSPRANQRPTAAFTAPSCTANEPCQFADASADSDGSVVSRSWSFEGGGIATGVNPVYTFPTAGTYSVTLTVTDDAGGTSSVTRSVTVTARALPGRVPIELSALVVVRQGSQRIRLTWTGGEGSTLELYRNGTWRERVINDGLYLRTRVGLRAGTYTYRLCERGTSNCSNSSSVTLP